jgi:SAM-dependent methyltransferase
MARKKGRGTDYDSFYYGRCLNLNQTEAYRRDERWLNFFGTIADRIVRDFGPQTVLDAGCAMGFLVEALRDRGVEAYGIDISEYALAQVREDIRPYCRKASVTAALKRKYDLIVCIETLEHLPKRDAEHAVQNFCAHTGDVLFSSTPHDYKEATHVNVMPRDYWAELFARLGFVHDLDYDPSTYLSPWAVRFRKSQEGLPRVAATYERVLARYQDENVALRELVLELRRQTERADGLEAELTTVRSSSAYRLAERVASLRRRLAPRDSRRGRLISQLAARISGSP